MALVSVPRLALALTLIASAPAFGQNVSPVPVLSSGSALLVVSAEGHSTRTPDLALFSAGVTSQGRTAGAALSANSADMNRVIAALKSAGIADKDIQTSQISLNPVYAQTAITPNNQGDNQPRIVGYQATNTVSVRSRDLKSFGRVLDTLVAAGANQINGPNFQLDHPEAAQDEARVAAIKSARGRAQLYASAAGLRVLRVISINEGGGYSPRPQPMFAMARVMKSDAAPTPIAEGEVETQVSVTVEFELAP